MRRTPKPKPTHEGRKPPSYRRHKATGQAIAELQGRTFYLGRHGTARSRRNYDQLIGEYLASGRRLPETDGLTVTELIAHYFRYAKGYYLKGGKPTSEISAIRIALRPLRRLYGPTPAAGFGPLALKAVRQRIVKRGLSRGVVNLSVQRIKAVFKWGVANELIPASVYDALRCVAGLRRGRSAARETQPIRPVADEDVDAIRPFVAPPVWAMIELQRLTGMRPGEVVIIRACDIDMTADAWSYRPESHKTEHHGHEKIIPLGPRAQEVIRPFLTAEISAYLFRPPVGRGIHGGRHYRNKKPGGWTGRRIGDRYTTDSYRRAIARACKAARVAHWHPHRLRHTVATRIRRQYGIDAARALLGHRSLAITDTYAELDKNLARRIAMEVG